MKSRVPISAFDSPSQASDAIWASRGVKSRSVSTLGFRALSPRSPELTSGGFSERFHAHRVEHPEGSAESFPGIDRSALAAEPFAVEEVRASELHPDASAP